MKTRKDRPRGPDIRINLTLFLEEHPLLTTELLRLPLGRPRTTRLCSLAAIGLLMERHMAAGRPLPMGGQGSIAAVGAADGAACEEGGTPVYAPRLSADQLAQLVSDDEA